MFVGPSDSQSAPGEDCTGEDCAGEDCAGEDCAELNNKARRKKCSLILCPLVAFVCIRIRITGRRD
jgi:hypothetical protein